MVKQFLNHIHRHDLCKTTDKILLAVSGGVDSMVMLHLFRQAGFTVGVAHCNFRLRGAASQGDEVLVAQVCRQQGLAFHVERFDTASHAGSAGLSIQMAARELRYDFFNKLLQVQGYACVATAHHMNDVLETVILNLAKGTGVEGLQGIAVKNNHIIRPLLFATREMVAQYAAAEGLQWREDASNATDDYQRNFIRHQVVPRLREVNPSLEHTFADTHERLKAAIQFTKKHLATLAEKMVRTDGTSLSIDKKLLQAEPFAAVVLWEWIKDRGFNLGQCREILEAHQPGKKIISATHVLVVDREVYLLQERVNGNIGTLEIGEHATTVQNGTVQLHLQHCHRDGFTLTRNPLFAHIDAAKVAFPLKWRPWRPGDHFIPLGMRHQKKLSDFFIDMKIPLPDKENITVVESDGTIIWVVGLRIGDDFKVTEGTSQILTLRLDRGLV